jgi:hypothetical protein
LTSASGRVNGPEKPPIATEMRPVRVSVSAERVTGVRRISAHRSAVQGMCRDQSCAAFARG